MNRYCSTVNVLLGSLFFLCLGEHGYLGMKFHEMPVVQQWCPVICVRLTDKCVDSTQKLCMTAWLWCSICGLCVRKLCEAPEYPPHETPERKYVVMYLWEITSRKFVNIGGDHIS